ncbi:unnamed protein product [Blepharisma stoltei]|uniref:Serine aminopeptidase S33 domain-containing protein n=1 Tax=Blepharisma stoltei TaxID=1481888 RepID=A0AAU9I6X8_9CILI|nr:unnamed protein product [Blepharisma stoltei]
MSDWWVKYQGVIPSAGVFFPEEDWLSLHSSSCHKLHTYRYPVSNPRALIFLFHGSFSSSSYYTHFASKLAKQKFEVLAFDQAGHGKSSGPRGVYSDLNNTYEDAAEYIFRAKEHYPKDTPIFLAGDGIGGTICLEIALSYPAVIKGLILFAPQIGVNSNFSRCQYKFSKWISFCYPAMLAEPIDIETLSRNPHNTSWWNENPDMVKGRIQIGTTVNLINAIERLRGRLWDIKTPFILFQGGKDNFSDPEQAETFGRWSRAEDKEFVIYENMHHFIANEPEFPEIIGRTINWLSLRLEHLEMNNHL